MAPGTALDDVVIDDIDEASLHELGQFFRWPRYYHAALLDTLTAAGVRAVGFDILFPEPDRLAPEVAEHYARRLRPDAPEATRQLLLAMGGDEALGQAAQRSGCTIFGIQVQYPEAGGDGRAVLPVPPIAAGARGFGHVQLVPDADGIVRRVPAVLSAGGQDWPSLALRLALDAAGLPASPLALDPVTGLSGPGWRVPSDPAGQILVDYAGPGGTFLRVSYADVLRGRVSPALFRDRIVLVGATASGLMDYFSTPFAAHFPGVEIHANLIHDLLHQRFVTPAPAVWDAAALWILATLAAAAVLLLPPAAASLACAALLAAFVVTCFELFAQAWVWLAFMLPLGGWMAAAAAASGFRYWTEERSKQAIKRAFSHYLAPEVVEELAAYPERLGLSGDERLLTVGFADIRDFTTLSEGLRAGQLAHLLNDYLSEMTAVIQAERGAVDKYIGDAIMMLFGAPNPLEDQAVRACRAGLTMCRLVEEQQSRWQAHGVEGLHIGLGINTGVAAVGNMGSSFRFAYTAMGDSVNLASRLEGLNKVYGTRIVIGPETASRAGADCCLRELDLGRVRGKREPVRIYELLGPATEAGTWGPLVRAFAAGLAEEGVWVQLGAVLVRAQHLLSGEQQVRTPVAVAAIRGTEFGVYVDRSGRTSLYVFDGSVALHNVRLPAQQVVIQRGQMSVVEPLRPPTAPAPFQGDEFDQLGKVGSLERAEDPVLESSESPAAESYLAFGDPDIDAVRNPAYLGESHGFSTTALLAAGGALSRDWIDAGLGRQDAERFAGNNQLWQHVTILPLGPGRWGGLFVEGLRDHSRFTGLRYAPFEIVGERRTEVTDLTAGNVRAMGATRSGPTTAATTLGHRRSSLEARDTVLVAGGIRDHIQTDSDATRLQLGLHRALAGTRGIGLTWARDLVSSTTAGGGLSQEMTGHADQVELLYRHGAGSWRRAGLLRLEREHTHEQFADGATALYDEERQVLGLKGGGGLGFTLSSTLVAAADLVAGYSREEASQHLPAGGDQEHEDDRRVSADLHLGMQLYLTRSVVLIADTHHLVERTRKVFVTMPRTAQQAEREEVVTQYTTAATSGLGYLRSGWLFQYYLQASGGDRPLSHNLVLLKSVY
ncbi:MAG: CHASE2 domain-containing protein [Gemmatimonadota bacterium]